jgi:hypothetical protein
MRDRRPPLMATWLLAKCGTSPSLIGDLEEQFQRGRSKAWYWRQALRASAARTYHNIRDHKLLAVQAILIACTFWGLYDTFVEEMARRFGLLNWMPVTFTLGAQVQLVVLLYMPALGMGWIVGRLYRGAHQAAMVLVVATYVLLTIPPGGTILLLFPHPPGPWLEVWSRSMSAQIASRYIPALVDLVLTMSITCFCMLATGLSVGGHRTSTPGRRFRSSSPLQAAFAVASLLAFLGLYSLVVKTIVERRYPDEQQERDRDHHVLSVYPGGARFVNMAPPARAPWFFVQFPETIRATRQSSGGARYAISQETTAEDLACRMRQLGDGGDHVQRVPARAGTLVTR